MAEAKKESTEAEAKVAVMKVKPKVVVAPKKEPMSTLKFETTPFGVRIIRAQGRVPDDLTGLYTSETIANAAITMFYSKGIR